MNTDWIAILIGQVVRHLLTVAAGLLTAYGVSADQATAIVGPATAIIVSIILFLIAQFWSAVSKNDALNTPPPRD